MEQEVKLGEQNKIVLSYKKVKMRIAVCDRNEKFLKSIKNIIYEYAEVRRLDIVVDLFSSGETMIKSKTNYNIVFLGYYLNGKNGLEIAKELRSFNKPLAIMFISENTDFIFDSFCVSPYRFIVPPVNREKFFVILDEFFQKYGNDYPIWIKYREETVCLDTSEIYYLEANNKHSVVYTEKSEFPCNKTMARVFDVLPKNHFAKINRAFIVNLNFVFSYNNDEICLKNNRTLHIGRKYLKSFKEEYREFLNPLEP